MAQKEMGVEQTFTRVVIKEIKNGFEIDPSWVKKIVPK
jgi:hypothetical protein